MNTKLYEWLRRYIPREVVGTCAALLCGYGAYILTENTIVSAIAGTWGENLGFYGLSIWQEVAHYRKTHKTCTGLKKVFLIGIKTIRNIVWEFGPAEVLDSFILRPFFMFVFQALGVGIGLLLGKLAADVVFNIIAVSSNEVRKKVFSND